MITVPADLKGVLAIVDKLANYCLPHISTWNNIEIDIIANDKSDAQLVADKMLGDVSTRFELVAMGCKEANAVERYGQSRGMVIMAEKVPLGTETIDNLQLSMAFIIAMCDHNYTPTVDDLFVDLEGKPFYKKSRSKP